MRRYIITTLICLAVVQLAAAKNPTALELLDKYAENADKMNSIIFKRYTFSEIVRIYSIPGQPAMKRKMQSEDEFRRDGKRGFWSFTRWGNVAPGGAWRDKGHGYGSRLYDGKSFYQHDKSRNSKTYPNGRVYLTRSNVERGSIQLATESMLLGFHSGNNGRIDKVLRKGRRVSVRERMENIDCEGQATLVGEKITYYQNLPDDLFEFEVPEGAMVIEE
ncbi:MAG: hypothetical protein WBC22_15965 [Sedimentisphaerales bacterium]